jgi:hypothetical protein
MSGGQITEESKLQQKLPPLSSVLLLKNNNNVTQKNADNLNSNFSIFQLSQTGALYSQAFHAMDKADLFIQPSAPSNKFNLQISEMSNSIASLHNLADMDVGTIPELRVKQNQILHFEELWNCKYFVYVFYCQLLHIKCLYSGFNKRFTLDIFRDFKCLSLNNISPFVLKTGALFISWKSVENFFEYYGHVAGFNCQKKSIIKDVIGNVRSLTYACIEGRFFDKKHKKHKKIVPCEWRVTLSYTKSDGHIIVTKFISQHNHELFSSLYSSERWRSDIIDNTNIKTISNIQTNSQYINKEEILMSFDALRENDSFTSSLKKFYRDNLWIIDNIGHPLTLYLLLFIK